MPQAPWTPQTIEMKAEILKKGLPLMSLMGLMQPTASHTTAQGQ